MTRAAFPLLALAATGIGCSRSSAESDNPPAPPTPVRTAIIDYVHRAEPVHATGVLVSKTEVRASFKVGGIVARFAVDEGDTIHAGQVLARLMTTEIDAGVEQARQAVVKAERDVARVTTLVDGKAATREQLDDSTTLVAVARAQLQAAEFNREHAVIRAAVDGKVMKRLVEAGELVAAGQPVLQITGEDRGWIVRVGLSDRDIVRIALADKATIALAAYPGEAVTATVSELASAATPPLDTYQVELRVQLPARVRAFSGLIAAATIEPRADSDAANVALVPAAALRDGDGKTAAVWVPASNGGVVRKRVQIAYFDGERVAIAAGLDGAASVITDGAAYLNASSRIAISAGASHDRH